MLPKLTKGPLPRLSVAERVEGVVVAAAIAVSVTVTLPAAACTECGASAAGGAGPNATLLLAPARTQPGLEQLAGHRSHSSHASHSSHQSGSGGGYSPSYTSPSNPSYSSPAYATPSYSSPSRAGSSTEVPAVTYAPTPAIVPSPAPATGARATVAREAPPDLPAIYIVKAGAPPFLKPGQRVTVYEIVSTWARLSGAEPHQWVGLNYLDLAQ